MKYAEDSGQCGYSGHLGNGVPCFHKHSTSCPITHDHSSVNETSVGRLIPVLINSYVLCRLLSIGNKTTFLSER